jgi:stearoyl-CoA desaturase (delta-9 desaturase)
VPQSILDEGAHADHHASVAAASAERAANQAGANDYSSLRRIVPVATAMAVATATASNVVVPKKAEGPAIRKDLSEEAHGLNAAQPTPPPGHQPPSA